MKKTYVLALACCLMVSAVAFAQTGFQNLQIDKNLIFPQFALGQGFTTQLVLMNPQPGRDLTGTLYFFNQDGTALQVLNGTETVSQMTVTIPATGVAFVSVNPVADAVDNLTVGWALLDITGATGQGNDDPRTRVSGSVIFTNTSGNTTVGQVGVVAGRYSLNNQKNVAIPVIVQGDAINTGVAFVNAGADPMTINFVLRDQTGAVVQDQATITPPVSPVAAGNQAARFVTELFPDFAFNDKNFQGTLTITTEQEGLVVVGLLANNLLLTSIPVVYVSPAAGAGAQTHDVTNEGFTFSPADLTITAGDSVRWQLANIHNVIEVTQATWDANGNTKKDGGFETDFGGGTVKFDTPGTYLYVCSPHASVGMKGKITVNPAS